MNAKFIKIPPNYDSPSSPVFLSPQKQTSTNFTLTRKESPHENQLTLIWLPLLLSDTLYEDILSRQSPLLDCRPMMLHEIAVACHMTP